MKDPQDPPSKPAPARPRKRRWWERRPAPKNGYDFAPAPADTAEAVETGPAPVAAVPVNCNCNCNGGRSDDD